ncbi:MAG: cytochrome C [Desulfobacterales bacterium SG8_35_2]|nr:MAG: cytochrome C [Desulfobacterales bacterium SG8_35_2]
MKSAKTSGILFFLFFMLCVNRENAGGAHILTPFEQLGKSIFFDMNLSINKNQACSSCHDPAAGWTGIDSEINAYGAMYQGSITSRFGERKPPSAAYAAVSPVMHYDRKVELFIGGNFWDGRATGEKLGNAAADQAQGPFLNPVEHGFADPACVVFRVCNADYPYSLGRVYPGECDIEWPPGLDVDRACSAEKSLVLPDRVKLKVNESFNSIALAVAAYEASPEVNPYSSKFDYYLQGKTQLTEDERQGFDLFNDKGKCSKCHISDGNKPVFTDFTYDNLGIPGNPENPAYKASSSFLDKGLGGFLEKQETPAAWQELAKGNMGKHKVPTLRNVDKRPTGTFVKAYMHNGYFKTLKGVVHFYNTRDIKPTCPELYPEEKAIAENCWPGPEIRNNVNNEELGDLKLTDKEEEAIVAFMKTLSDGFALEEKNGE